MTGYQLASFDSSTKNLTANKPVYDKVENFDPSLARLNTMSKLVAYCDSLYNEKEIGDEEALKKEYADIASSVVRNRFYHGYSTYGFSNNYMAVMMEQVSIDGLSAIVMPDDILEYPYAACSQQSIVLMEVLRQKGMSTRKVGFKGKLGGHFCFEVFYEGSWHFYDPDMEPDRDVLAAYNRPGIAFLVNNPTILQKAYSQYPTEKVMDLFPTFWYGSVDTFPAPKAIVFHKVTKFLSYTISLFFLMAFIWARRKYKKLSRQYVRNNRIHIPVTQQGTSQVYYPNYSAQGA
jgi:hypothetical protein